MHLRATGVAVLAALAMAGCQPEINKDVMIVSDSVTAQSATAIVKEFSNVSTTDGGRYIASFGSSVGGQGLTYMGGVALADMDAFWSAHVQSLMEHGQPELILVELGYNDCKQLAGYDARIDNFMSGTGDVPVFWLTLADQKDLWNGGHCDDTINSELAAAVGRWPNLRLLPYRTWALANPTLFVDAVHLTAKGYDAYANWLKAQLDALYPS